MQNYVYFLQCEGGPIKIGKTNDPLRRMKQFRTHNPYPLELLTLIYSKKDEDHSSDVTNLVVGQKRCTHCKQVKDLNQFSIKRKERPDPFHPMCIECHQKYKQELYARKKLKQKT